MIFLDSDFFKPPNMLALILYILKHARLCRLCDKGEYVGHCQLLQLQQRSVNSGSDNSGSPPNSGHTPLTPCVKMYPYIVWMIA